MWQAHACEKGVRWWEGVREASLGVCKSSGISFGVRWSDFGLRLESVGGLALGCTLVWALCLGMRRWACLGIVLVGLGRNFVGGTS